MKSYKALRAQIAKLEQQAETIRRTEVKAVIAQLKKTISQYGLTAEELGLGGGGKAKAVRGARKTAARRSAGAPKYRDPKSGQTWTGRGRPPAWIATAKDRNAFLIDAPAAEAAPAAAPKRAKAAKAAKPAAKPAAKRATRKTAAKRPRKTRAAKTAAVQIESGVAME
ncbi:MAG: H-NS histone family protein [Piscinibacter sp.]|nr:H-NS histone family protein [Piscinibacter sp.]